jgi:hypothetical protein
MRITPIDAYSRMIQGVEDVSALSLNKQVCIQFMKWVVYAEDEDRVTLIELAI